jgi:hypothetical protein
MKKVSYICIVDSEVGSIDGVSKHSRKCSTKKKLKRLGYMKKVSYICKTFKNDC